MTTPTDNQPPQPPQQPHSQQPPQYAQQPVTPGSVQPKGLAITALIVGIAAFLMGLLPVAGIILGIAGIIFGAIALKKKQPKGLAITGLVLGAIGVIASLIITIGLGSLTNQVIKELESAEVSVTEETDSDTEDSDADSTDRAIEESADEDGEEGSRGNPFPLGATVSNDDFEIKINDVDLDATQAVLDASDFNDEPAAGNTFITVNLTVKYIGDNADGEMPMYIIEYVTQDGNRITQFDTLLTAPNEIDSIQKLEPGSFTSGNIAFEVPADTAGEGTILVQVDPFSDKVFFAVK